MKFFQKLFRKELTPIEQLAEYEAKIAYYQSVVKTQIDYVKELKSNIDICRNRGDSIGLRSYLRSLNTCNEKIDDAQSNIEYYKVLTEDLKKELEQKN